MQSVSVLNQAFLWDRGAASADFFEDKRHCTLLGLVRALGVSSQDRQGHGAARLCLCWMDILRWDTWQNELVLQQRPRTNIPSCVSGKHLASLKIPERKRQLEMGKHLLFCGLQVLYTQDQLCLPMPKGAWERIETTLGFPLHFPTCH